MNQETIVVVYSLSGKAYTYAQELAQAEGAPCLRIETKHKNSFWGYMQLGYAARLKKPIQFKKFDFDFTQVKRCILVCPIHASQVCAPVRSFLFSHRSFLNHIDLILTHRADDIDFLEAATKIEKELIFKFNSVKSITIK